MSLRAPLLVATLSLSAAFATACGNKDGDDTADTDAASNCSAPYAPFDAANYENQFLRVGAYTEIVALRKGDNFAATDFAEIEDLYLNTASLAEKVEGRTDDHAEASVPAIGAVLHGDITDAIAAGMADTDISVQGQIVDKTLQRFFGLSVLHEGLKSADDANTLEEAQAGWDEGFGYLGISNDGQDVSGIAGTLASRDEEFGFSTAETAFNGLLDGRCALANGDREAAVAAIMDVDEAIMTGFALSVVHEMDEYADDPLIKGWEALLYYRAIADQVGVLDAGAKATVDAEFEKGVEAIDAAVVRAAIVDAYGFGI
jgi:hypothetical protein